MEKLYYDLHIHSCLSPCGDDDMTPNNIVSMARLKDLDVIAVTDHNSCGNGPAVRGAAERANREWRRMKEAEQPEKPGQTEESDGAKALSQTEQSDRAKSLSQTVESGRGGETGRAAGSSPENLVQNPDGLILLYGAEVESAEEVHSLCLFASLEEAQTFEQALKPFFADVKNRKDIYGSQCRMDEYDRVTGEEERLLAFAASLSFYDLLWMTRELGGAFVPAHIDKPVYSVLSNMGFIPEELPIAAVEVSLNGIRSGFLKAHPEISEQYKVITSSDAHYLGDIAERERFIELRERSAQAVIDWLKSS